jgi:hypothetical protein
MSDIKLIPGIPRVVGIRPLADGEIETLEEILGEKAERKHLVYWMSQAISDVVLLSQPPARQRCKELRRIAREGRLWLRDIDLSSDMSLLPAKAAFNKVTPQVKQFCEIADSLARDLESTIKRGQTRTPPALNVFFDRMMGITKAANVLPIIPGRAIRSQTAPREPPPFFQFIKAAMAVARDVINSSEVPATVNDAALETLRKRSDDALVKILVRLRGRIGNYQEGPRGVTEWNDWQPRRRSPHRKR